MGCRLLRLLSDRRSRQPYGSSSVGSFSPRAVRRDQPSVRRWTRGLGPALRVSRITSRLPRSSDPYAESGGVGGAPNSWPCESQGGRVPARVDLGGVWRSSGPSAARELLGKREPHWAKRRI